jgi:feruloyl esterase
MKWHKSLPYSTLVAAVNAIDCSMAGFKALLPANVSVTSAYALPENSTFQVPAGDIAFPSSPTGLRALCALQAQVPAPGNTTYGFGMFLPSNWNGRFL